MKDHYKTIAFGIIYTDKMINAIVKKSDKIVNGENYMDCINTYNNYKNNVCSVNVKNN